MLKKNKKLKDAPKDLLGRIARNPRSAVSDATNLRYVPPCW
jgi:hypothetical protein